MNASPMPVLPLVGSTSVVCDSGAVPQQPFPEATLAQVKPEPDGDVHGSPQSVGVCLIHALQKHTIATIAWQQMHVCCRRHLTAITCTAWQSDVLATWNNSGSSVGNSDVMSMGATPCRA